MNTDGIRPGKAQLSRINHSGNGTLYGVKLFPAEVEQVVCGRDVVEDGTQTVLLHISESTAAQH